MVETSSKSPRVPRQTPRKTTKIAVAVEMALRAHIMITEILDVAQISKLRVLQVEGGLMRAQDSSGEGADMFI